MFLLSQQNDSSAQRAPLSASAIESWLFSKWFTENVWSVSEKVVKILNLRERPLSKLSEMDESGDQRLEGIQIDWRDLTSI